MRNTLNPPPPESFAPTLTRCNVPLLMSSSNIDVLPAVTFESNFTLSPPDAFIVVLMIPAPAPAMVNSPAAFKDKLFLELPPASKHP